MVYPILRKSAVSREVGYKHVVMSQSNNDWNKHFVCVQVGVAACQTVHLEVLPPTID